MDNHIILFDFEYTAWEGSRERKWSEAWEHREIIQIAALRVALDPHLAEAGCFDCLVKPHHNPLLSAYITALTGIEQTDIDARGQDFPAAFAAFYAFCDPVHTPLYCYGDDLTVLSENCAIHALPLLPFPAGIYDIRATFEEAGIATHRYTSGTVYQATGAQFEHAAHNALNDVRSLALTIRQLSGAGRIQAGCLAAENHPSGRFPIP